MWRQGASRVTVLGTTLSSPFFVLAERERKQQNFNFSNSENPEDFLKGQTCMTVDVPGKPVIPMISPLLIVLWISSKFCSASLKGEGRRERERERSQSHTDTHYTYMYTYIVVHIPCICHDLNFNPFPSQIVEDELPSIPLGVDSSRHVHRVCVNVLPRLQMLVLVNKVRERGGDVEFVRVGRGPSLLLC